MLMNILLYFLLITSFNGASQESVNSKERISLENCAFKESGAARHDCYSDILQALFVEEINNYLEDLDLEPKTVFQTLIEIKLDKEGTFELTKINTEHKKIEALIKRRTEKLEAVLPFQDEKGDKIASSFSIGVLASSLSLRWG